MMLVEALIMGAGYKAGRFHRQAKTQGRNTKAAPMDGLCSELTWIAAVRAPGSTAPEPAGSRFPP